ncbi:MAG: hypothetical protein HN380_22845 [Victivallales bacterium]|nr:hypothetical protein [Victivallales bacterium]
MERNVRRNWLFAQAVCLAIVLLAGGCAHMPPEERSARSVVEKTQKVERPTARAPRVLVGSEELARLRRNAATQEEPFASAWQKVLAAAEEAMTAATEVYDGADSVKLRFAGIETMGRVRDLCLAHHVAGEERYAAKARELFMAWAQHSPVPGSRLSREAYAGQSHGGTIAGLGLNVGLLAMDAAHAYSLVWEHLTPRERGTTERWLRFLAVLIRDGHEAWTENDYYGKQDFNNHLSGHNMGLAAIGFALRDQAMIDYALDSPENPRDWKEMHNGAILTSAKRNADQLWHGDLTLTKGAASPATGEIYDRYRVVTVRKGRGCGMPYAFFHQKMLTQTAEMAHQNGIDLYDYTGPYGENLRLTYEAYAPHLLKQEPVARSGYYIRNRVYEAHVHMYELANRRYPDSEQIGKVLRTLNRAVLDHEAFGWTSVLLYGENR